MHNCTSPRMTSPWHHLWPSASAQAKTWEWQTEIQWFVCPLLTLYGKTLQKRKTGNFKIELYFTEINCGGSSMLEDPKTISRFIFIVSLCAVRNWSIKCEMMNKDKCAKGVGINILWKISKQRTSDLVAPPIMKTKIRLPSLLKSPDACLRTEESLPSQYILLRMQLKNKLIKVGVLLGNWQI